MVNRKAIVALLALGGSLLCEARTTRHEEDLSSNTLSRRSDSLIRELQLVRARRALKVAGESPEHYMSMDMSYQTVGAAKKKSSKSKEATTKEAKKKEHKASKKGMGKLTKAPRTAKLVKGTRGGSALAPESEIGKGAVKQSNAYKAIKGKGMKDPMSPDFLLSMSMATSTSDQTEAPSFSGSPALVTPTGTDSIPPVMRF